jgi:hypothetical protein
LLIYEGEHARIASARAAALTAGGVVPG